MHTARRNGFTLIELSIVLVIIGLIAGGVLAGKELIFQAEMRKAVSQMNEFNTAANTFKNKYNCIPGDCLNGLDLGFRSRGNGNGLIEVNCCYWPDGVSNEPTAFWTMLKDAQLISSPIEYLNQYGAETAPGIHSPRFPGGKSFHYAPTDPGYGGWYMWDMVVDADAVNSGDWLSTVTADLGTAVPLWRTWFIGANIGGAPYGILSRNQAFAVDSKIDDGKPLTGNMLCISSNLYGAGAASPAVNWSANCAYTNNNSYGTGDDTNYGADYIIKASF